MNKKKIVSLFLSSFILLALPIYVIGEERLIKTVVSVARFSIYEIIHTPINTVSSIQELFAAKISVDFGMYKSATAEIMYYLNGQSGDVHTVDKGTILNKQDFYIQLPEFAPSDTQVDYKIKITFKDVSDNTVYGYWPSGTTFQTALITDSISTVVGSSGGTVEFESGNQQYDNTKIIIPAGSLSSDVTITITQLPISGAYPAPGLAPSASSQMVAMYRVESTPPGLEVVPPAQGIFYYGSQTEATKFELKYRTDATSEWETVAIKEINTRARTITAEISKMGEYAIFVSSNLTDNDYRPEKRVKVKTRISGGNGFKFNNLKEGDSVKIYNVNGKKIREISSGDIAGFEWNGKKDNGDWAESGTYIYQIKLKEKGKVISGTIAFVW